MSFALHPKRWWAWCVSEDEKMEIDSIFIKEVPSEQYTNCWY